jgi:hypothetical protein
MRPDPVNPARHGELCLARGSQKAFAMPACLTQPHLSDHRRPSFGFGHQAGNAATGRKPDLRLAVSARVDEDVTIQGLEIDPMAPRVNPAAVR